MPKNMKKIIKVADMRRDLSLSAGGCVSSQVDIIYDVGEYDADDGYIKFADGRGWYVGCTDGFYVEFDDGSSRVFLGLHDAYGDRDTGMISEVIAELRRIVFGLDNEEDDPVTDMPDIF